jgi:hypothetical protein
MQFFNNLSDIINIKQLSLISILSWSPNHATNHGGLPSSFVLQTSQTARTDGTYYYENHPPFAFILIPSASVLYTTRLRGDCFQGFVEVGAWMHRVLVTRYTSQENLQRHCTLVAFNPFKYIILCR